MGKFANGAKNAGSWLDKFATGPNAQKGWDAIFKLGNYSGSGAHQAVLKVGHLVGHKFKPWEAVKMAGKIGKVGKFLGVGGALIGVGLQIWDDQQEEKVEKWIRSYQLKGKELRINDRFTLKEAVAPNQVNFMTWGDVQKVSDGKVSITVNGVKALLVYDASTFDLNIETKDVNDGRLTPVWDNKVYRLSLNAKKMTMKGNYSFVIKKQ